MNKRKLSEKKRRISISAESILAKATPSWCQVPRPQLRRKFGFSQSHAHLLCQAPDTPLQESHFTDSHESISRPPSLPHLLDSDLDSSDLDLRGHSEDPPRRSHAPSKSYRKRSERWTHPLSEASEGGGEDWGRKLSKYVAIFSCKNAILFLPGICILQNYRVANWLLTK